MRRLYSTFADGWPGLGLLLLRLVIGAVVLEHASALATDTPAKMVFCAVLALAGVLVIAGLWTPIAGTVIGIAAIFEIVTGQPLVGHLLAAAIAGALTMLGPGRLSIDARLFGWRRVESTARRPR